MFPSVIYKVKWTDSEEDSRKTRFLPSQLSETLWWDREKFVQLTNLLMNTLNNFLDTDCLFKVIIGQFSSGVISVASVRLHHPYNQAEIVSLFHFLFPDQP